MYNLTEYSTAYLKTSESLWQYYRNEPRLGGYNNNIDFTGNSNNITLFKFKQQTTVQTGKGGTKDVEIMVLLKYLSNFGWSLERPLINCKINLQLTCSNKSILAAGTAANQITKFRITDTKLYVPIVTLSTQDNIKLFKKLESGFKRIVFLNKYDSKKTNQAQNRYFNLLINSSFQGVNRLFFYHLKVMMVGKFASNIIFQLWK